MYAYEANAYVVISLSHIPEKARVLQLMGIIRHSRGFLICSTILFGIRDIIELRNGV